MSIDPQHIRNCRYTVKSSVSARQYVAKLGYLQTVAANDMGGQQWTQELPSQNQERLDLFAIMRIDLSAT